mmetsp:Transcript_30052/g.30546  ORF Transcript_30052/g.30546 Transcript_30052/m.30546 type:complete len:120 (+) Transcript_30052:269-628(+)
MMVIMMIRPEEKRRKYGLDSFSFTPGEIFGRSEVDLSSYSSVITNKIRGGIGILKKTVGQWTHPCTNRRSIPGDVVLSVRGRGRADTTDGSTATTPIQTNPPPYYIQNISDFGGGYECM